MVCHYYQEFTHKWVTKVENIIQFWKAEHYLRLQSCDFL